MRIKNEMKVGDVFLSRRNNKLIQVITRIKEDRRGNKLAYLGTENLIEGHFIQGTKGFFLHEILEAGYTKIRTMSEKELQELLAAYKPQEEKTESTGKRGRPRKEPPEINMWVYRAKRRNPRRPGAKLAKRWDQYPVEGIQVRKLITEGWNINWIRKDRRDDVIFLKNEEMKK